MIFKIYCLRDETDTVRYIGYTSLSECRRMAEHRHSHPERRGWKFEVIDVFDTKKEALEAERLYIAQYRDSTPNLDNVADGQGYPESLDGYRGVGHRLPVYCVETDTVYKSCTEAAEALNIPHAQHVARCVSGHRLSCHGYHFRKAKSEAKDETGVIHANTEVSGRTKELPTP